MNEHEMILELSEIMTLEDVIKLWPNYYEKIILMEKITNIKEKED